MHKELYNLCKQLLYLTKYDTMYKSIGDVECLMNFWKIALIMQLN